MTESPNGLPDADAAAVKASLMGPDDGRDPSAPDDGPAKTMSRRCHRCGRPLSPTTGRVMNGRVESSGVCPDCRLDGVGSAAFVDLDDPAALRGPLPDDRPIVQGGLHVDTLTKRQRNAVPQSTTSAAAFVDDLMPPGQYVARRTSPMAVVLAWEDDVDVDRQTRLALTKRLKNVPTERRWSVQSFPSFIRLVDHQAGESDEVTFRETIPGQPDAD